MNMNRLSCLILTLIFIAVGCKKKEAAPVQKATTPEELCKAARAGDIERVRSLLSSGVDLSGENQDAWGAIHHAAAMGHTDLVELLIARGADINARDLHDRTPLLLAIGYKKGGGMAELLVANGAEVNVMDQTGDTPLLAALRNADESLAKFLITKGAEVNVLARTPRQPKLPVVMTREPLHYAALYGFEHVTELLIAKGAKVDARDRNNDAYTPLHQAVAKGHREVVKILVANGADVNAKTKPWHGGDGKTAMDIASLAGHEDIVELLRTKGGEFGIGKSIDK